MGYLDNTGLATLWSRIKQLKLANPNTLKFTGNASASYDGSSAVSVNIPTALKNPNKLTFTGAATGSYDGSSAVTVDIPNNAACVVTSENSYDEVAELIAEGKVPIYKDDYGDCYVYNCIRDTSTLTYIHFNSCGLNVIYGVTLNSNNVWSEISDNSVASVSKSNTFSAANTFTGAITIPTPTANTHAATKKYVDDAVSGGGGGGTELPTGTVNIFAGSTAPSGWLLCDGDEASRTTYADLFAVIGTTYGSGDGSTTFNLPDLCNNVPVGAGGLYRLGAMGGERTHTLSTSEMPSHTHAQNSHTHTQNAHTHTQAAHSHTPYTSANRFMTYNYGTVSAGLSERAVAKASSGNYMAPVINNADTDYVAYNITGSTTATNNSTTATNQSTTATNQNTGGGGAHNNMQPYVAMNYIIKY